MGVGSEGASNFVDRHDHFADCQHPVVPDVVQLHLVPFFTVDYQSVVCSFHHDIPIEYDILPGWPHEDGCFLDCIHSLHTQHTALLGHQHLLFTYPFEQLAFVGVLLQDEDPASLRGDMQLVSSIEGTAYGLHSGQDRSEIHLNSQLSLRRVLPHHVMGVHNCEQRRMGLQEAHQQWMELRGVSVQREYRDLRVEVYHQDMIVIQEKTEVLVGGVASNISDPSHTLVVEGAQIGQLIVIQADLAFLKDEDDALALYHFHHPPYRGGVSVRCVRSSCSLKFSDQLLPGMVDFLWLGDIECFFLICQYAVELKSLMVQQQALYGGQHQEVAVRQRLVVVQGVVSQQTYRVTYQQIATLQHNQQLLPLCSQSHLQNRRGRYLP